MTDGQAKAAVCELTEDELAETARNQAEAWARSGADGPMSYAKMFAEQEGETHGEV